MFHNCKTIIIFRYQKFIIMKKLLFLSALLCVTISIQAQDNKELVLNEDTNLIEAKIYHDNGVVAQTGSYTVDGLLQGQWISYNTDGGKTAVANYNQGKKVGTWLFYMDETLKEVTFTDSRIATVSTYQIKDTRVVSNKK